MRKKFILVVILSAVAVFVTGCSEGVKYSEGVDVQYFRPALSSIGTTAYLIPDNFLEEFEYTENKFYRYSNDRAFSFGDMDKNLMYLEYSDEVYEEAKDFVLTEMDLDLSDERIYNGYTFYMNYAHEHNDGPKEIFPYRYFMAGYNDAKNRIIFISMDCVQKAYPEAEQGLTDFGWYLQTFFGEFYDFDA